MSVSSRVTHDDSQREIQALLAVSRDVAQGGPLRSLLDRIALEAASVVGAKAGSILLLQPNSRFRLAGAYGLSSRYSSYLETMPVVEGQGPSGLVLKSGAPVLIADACTDARLGPERIASFQARKEGFKAMASLPLLAADQLIGVLHVYRVTEGSWPQHQVDLLAFFSEHAANAITTARLIERQQTQVAALSNLVRALRQKTHEHANRIHTIGGLLALGEHAQLRRFVSELELDYSRSHAAITEIGNPTVAGLILAETAVAKQRGINLTLRKNSRLPELPPSLGDSDAAMILGNLLANAFDAVEGCPKSRRRVSVTLASTPRGVVFKVRDWGCGIAVRDRGRILESGFTTKGDHSGLGLELVNDAVRAASGTLEVEHLDSGTMFVVRFPGAG